MGHGGACEGEAVNPPRLPKMETLPRATKLLVKAPIGHGRGHGLDLGLRANWWQAKPLVKDHGCHHELEEKERVQARIKDMTTRRAFARRTEGENVDQGAPPQAPKAHQAPVVPLAEKATNAEFRTILQVLGQDMTT
uniref:Integrase core domain containing protein n=1 Tax=Solanum tuberosum TaxID=4113 RepID=M1DJB9_SOLTU